MVNFGIIAVIPFPDLMSMICGPLLRTILTMNAPVLLDLLPSEVLTRLFRT